MSVFKLDEFMGFQISGCQMCNKKKTKIHWCNSFKNIHFCETCWKMIIEDGINDEYKTDKNGVLYVEFKFQLEDEPVEIVNIAVQELLRKKFQMESW